MTKRKATTKPKRKRRKYSDEFKREAVKLITEQGLSVADAATNLGINASMLRAWKNRLDLEDEDTSVPVDADDSKGHRWMRRGEVLLWTGGI